MSAGHEVTMVREGARGAYLLPLPDSEPARVTFVETGPNLIAIGELSSRHPITFLHWMLFGVPVALAMVGISYVMLILIHRVKGRVTSIQESPAQLTRQGWMVVTIFFCAVAGWVLEPFHGIPAAVVALMIAAALFGLRLVGKSELARLEWSTLILVAGGLSFGHLVEASGLAATVAGGVQWTQVNSTFVLFAMLLGCATFSALASNTAAAAMVIPIAMTITASPSIAILIALSASMGVPFVFSTPPNSLAYGQGHIRPRQLFIPGLLLMLIGCGLLTVLGPSLMRLVGIP